MPVKKVPKPTSGGLILSYKCSAECRHCIYACSQKWKADPISEDDLEKILKQLSGKIMPSIFGPKGDFRELQPREFYRHLGE